MENIKKLLNSVGYPDKFTMEAIRPEASERRYYRITFPDCEENGSVILCKCKPLQKHTEDDFVTIGRVLEKNGIPVPHIIAIDAKGGYLLQSDCGDTDLSEELQKTMEYGSPDRVKMLLRSAISILIRMQGVNPVSPVIERRFDNAKLKSEIDFFMENLEGVCKRFSIKTEAFMKYTRSISDICISLGSARPEVFTHRDYHARNIIVNNRAEELNFNIIDFQDARMGLPWYDLSSLLLDPYVLLPYNFIEYGYEFYLGNTDFKPDESRRLFWMQGFQRMIKATGTYLHMTFRKGMIKYYQNIRPALESARLAAVEGGLPGDNKIFVEVLLHEVLPRIEEKVNEEDRIES